MITSRTDDLIPQFLTLNYEKNSLKPNYVSVPYDVTSAKNELWNMLLMYGSAILHDFVL